MSTKIKADQVAWRRYKVVETRARGMNQAEIARELQDILSTMFFVSSLSIPSNDGIIVKQEKESTPDDPEDGYEITQNIDKICNDFRDDGISF